MSEEGFGRRNNLQHWLYWTGQWQCVSFRQKRKKKRNASCCFGKDRLVLNGSGQLDRQLFGRICAWAYFWNSNSFLRSDSLESQGVETVLKPWFSGSKEMPAALNSSPGIEAVCYFLDLGPLCPLGIKVSFFFLQTFRAVDTLLQLWVFCVVCSFD